MKSAGEHGQLYHAQAGVYEFEFKTGREEEWVNVLKAKVEDVIDSLDPDSFVEVSNNNNNYEKKIADSLHKTMAYNSEMLKEEYASVWAASFMKSMEGGKCYTCEDPATNHTFDVLYIVVVVNRFGYVLIDR